MNSHLGNELFYAKNYAKLYLKPGEEVFEFNFNKGEFFFKNIALKKPILKIGEIEITDGLYDLETPYGYGGFFTNSKDLSFVEEAMSAYKNEVASQSIISEFLRFNVFNAFPKTFESQLEFCVQERNTIAIDLDKTEDELLMSYKSKLRRDINRAKRDGLEFLFLDKTEGNIALFTEMYLGTMSKVDADEFYYFDLAFFKGLIPLEKVKLAAVRYEDKIINTALILEEETSLYYHLSASNKSYSHLNGTALLLHSVASHYLKKKDFLFLGGGNSIDENDPLFRFKLKFNPTEQIPFYIGGKVYDDKYYEYCELRQEQSENKIPYFLKYRF